MLTEIPGGAGMSVASRWQGELRLLSGASSVGGLIVVFRAQKSGAVFCVSRKSQVTMHRQTKMVQRNFAKFMGYDERDYLQLCEQLAKKQREIDEAEDLEDALRTVRRYGFVVVDGDEKTLADCKVKFDNPLGLAMPSTEDGESL